MKKSSCALIRGSIAEAFIISALKCKNSNVIDSATWKVVKFLMDDLVKAEQENLQLDLKYLIGERKSPYSRGNT